jgi:hypothetical protein
MRKAKQRTATKDENDNAGASTLSLPFRTEENNNDATNGRHTQTVYVDLNSSGCTPHLKTNAVPFQLHSTGLGTQRSAPARLLSFS